jgi:nitrogenase subunit NifH
MTVLEYIKTHDPSERKAEDIVFRGFGDVACVESGGPEPGVGCAGRGVITTFELLEELGVQSSLFDVTLYDVLGDVVCGGFAVPIRSEYADAVYIITSGEFMSLYAANNILKGIRKFTETKNRNAGIIHNARGDLEEDLRVKRFADAVSLPVVIQIPRSDIFAKSEKDGCTVIQRYPDSPEAVLFHKFAQHTMILHPDNGGLLYPAAPLSDTDLECIVLMRNEIVPNTKFIFHPHNTKSVQKTLSVSVKNKRPLIGCAFAGAVSASSQVTDAATVMHGPRSCTLMMYEKLLDTLQNSSIRFGHEYRKNLTKRLYSTDMADEDFIFGGETKLKETLESVISDGFSLIFIVTTCPPGIIGDDIDKVIAGVTKQHDAIRIVPIKVDGNLVGDYVQGVMDAHNAVISLVEKDISSGQTPLVNIIAEKWLAENEEQSIKAVLELLDRLGIGINCRFLIHSDSRSLIRFNEASLNLPADRDDTVASIKTLLAPVSSVPFLDMPLPTGFFETKEWLMAVARVFDMEEKAREIIEAEEIKYKKKIELLKPDLERKTILISTYPKSVDWVCDLAYDLGMSILKIGLTYSPFSEEFISRYSTRFPIVHNYTLEMRSDDIRDLKPDLVLLTYPSLRRSDYARSAHIPYCPGFGFLAGIDRAMMWIDQMKVPVIEGWKLDGDGIT